jgi:hypothetical protein
MTTSLGVVSPDAEAVFVTRAARRTQVRRAASLGELRTALESWAGEVTGGGTGGVRLDLMGHSTAGHHLLRLGRTPIDMLDRPTARFFGGLVADGLTGRLEITSVRLLGCETAVTDAGQRTMRMLSRALRVPVYGTLVPIMKHHCDADGLMPIFDRLLVEASALG